MVPVECEDLVTAGLCDGGEHLQHDVSPFHCLKECFRTRAVFVVIVEQEAEEYVSVEPSGTGGFMRWPRCAFCRRSSRELTRRAPPDLAGAELLASAWPGANVGPRIGPQSRANCSRFWRGFKAGTDIPYNRRRALPRAFWLGPAWSQGWDGFFGMFCDQAHDVTIIIVGRRFTRPEDRLPGDNLTTDSPDAQSTALIPAPDAVCVTSSLSLRVSREHHTCGKICA